MPPSEDFVYEPKLRNTRERNDKNQIVSNSYVSHQVTQDARDYLFDYCQSEFEFSYWTCIIILINKILLNRYLTI